MKNPDTLAYQNVLNAVTQTEQSLNDIAIILEEILNNHKQEKNLETPYMHYRDSINSFIDISYKILKLDHSQNINIMAIIKEKQKSVLNAQTKVLGYFQQIESQAALDDAPAEPIKIIGDLAYQA